MIYFFHDKKMWSLLGTRVVTPVYRRFKWGYLFAALEVEEDRITFLYTYSLSKDYDAAFIKQVLATHLIKYM